MKIRDYQTEALLTDKIPWENENGADVPFLGILGEVGSISTVLKKHQRDGDAYDAFSVHVREELGDVLWYIAITASRLGITLQFEPGEASNVDALSTFYALSSKVMMVVQFRQQMKAPSIPSAEAGELIEGILCDMHGIATAFGSHIETIADENCKKIKGFWGGEPTAPSRQFDQEFPVYERVPRHFEIEFIEINKGRALILQMNKIAIGDRLTDNSYSDDGYRYHDIFHLANVATLGWSPVFRRMLRCKRKSDSRVDEVQDGARAAIIEEALINHIYAYARDHNYLDGLQRVDPDLIKRVLNLVRGYEVDICEPWEWQHCIMQGYAVYRLLRKHHGGRVRIDADKRSLNYLSPLNP